MSEKLLGMKEGGEGCESNETVSESAETGGEEKHCGRVRTDHKFIRNQGRINRKSAARRISMTHLYATLVLCSSE